MAIRTGSVLLLRNALIVNVHWSLKDQYLGNREQSCSQVIGSRS